MTSKFNVRTFAWAASLLSSCLLLVISGCANHNPGPVVSQAELDADLSSGKLVLVKFGAKWCGPCQMVDAELDKLAKRAPQLKIIEVDIDSNKGLAQKYKVNGIPNMILVRSNEILDRQVGYMSAEELTGWVDSVNSANSPDPS